MANPKKLKELEFRTEEELERLVLDGLNSGSPIEVNEEYWERLRQRIRDKAAAKPTSGRPKKRHK